MRAFVIKVFDDVIEGSSNVYTAEQWNELLADADQLALFVVADTISVNTQLTVDIEHANDGRTWTAKSATPPIDRVSVDSGVTNVLSGYDDGAIPSQCHVRARLKLDTAVRAHIKLWLTGRRRDSAVGSPSSAAGRFQRYTPGPAVSHVRSDAESNQATGTPSFGPGPQPDVMHDTPRMPPVIEPRQSMAGSNFALQPAGVSTELPCSHSVVKAALGADCKCAERSQFMPARANTQPAGHALHAQRHERLHSVPPGHPCTTATKKPERFSGIHTQRATFQALNGAPLETLDRDMPGWPLLEFGDTYTGPIPPPESCSVLDWAMPFTQHIHVPTISYPKLQSAIDAIQPGGLITVSTGVFYENLNIEKNVTIRGLHGFHLFPFWLPSWIKTPPLVSVAHGRQVRLQNMHLHHGGIVGAAAESSFSGPFSPMQNPTVLELESVRISNAGSHGAITGLLHLKAQNVNIEASLGDGIHIVGSADIRHSVVTSCNGWGAVINNLMPTPTLTRAGAWTQRICRSSFTQNGIGGLGIANSVGQPFDIVDCYLAHNEVAGLVLQNVRYALVRAITATHQPNGHGVIVQRPFNVFAAGLSEVSISSSELSYNRAGLSVIGCGELGETRVDLKGTKLLWNDVHILALRTVGCADYDIHVDTEHEPPFSNECEPPSPGYSYVDPYGSQCVVVDA